MQAEELRHYGVMEVLEENNFQSLSEYLRNIGLNVEPEDILDYVYYSENSLCLSQFPKYVSDINKYNNSEIFYQKYIDHNIKKKDFLGCEHRYHKALQMLWLYDQVYVGIYIDKEMYARSYYRKKIEGYSRKIKNLFCLL